MELEQLRKENDQLREQNRIVLAKNSELHDRLSKIKSLHIKITKELAKV